MINGKYEILKEIGHGGMSTVYLAMDKNLNKQWAVKEIRKNGNDANDLSVVNSLQAEADLMKKLDHPALPRIVDIINNAETICIIMDYIEGETLEKIISEYGAQPEETVIGWAMQLCDALQYLHSQKPPIIYRDMKPANVMLNPEGNLKVIDFGIAREYKEKSLADTTTLGTRGYCPPEQYGKQTDARSDIYALGMTMHHLLTGQDPRLPGYEYASIRQYRSELSSSLERIVDKCVAIDPENRYQSCSELMYALQNREHDEEQYIKKQKRKLRSFIVASAMTILFAASGITLHFVASGMNRNDYENLIGVSESTSYTEKIDNYEQAISIYPNDTRAYLKLLEAYEQEGVFGKEQNDAFLALYNANREGFTTGSDDFSELNYKIGMMYFNYYISESGEVQFSEQVQKAYPFFKENYENASDNFSEKKISDCYYQICLFYKTYILNNINVEEASKSDYETLLDTIDAALTEVADAGAYDQLTLYNGVVMLLYDQRANLKSANLEQERVLTLLDNVYEKAKSLSVNKEQSKNLQEEILGCYEEYRNAIVRTYSNTEIKTETTAEAEG